MSRTESESDEQPTASRQGVRSWHSGLDAALAWADLTARRSSPVQTIVVTSSDRAGTRQKRNPAALPRGHRASSSWRDFGRCRRAVAALEFALASGPLLLMLFGFIATNALFYTWSMMQNNAQYAAMMIATGQVTSFSATPVACSSSLTNAQVEYYACSGLPTWTTFTAKVTETCSVPNVSVTLTTNASSAGLADVYAIFTGKTLTTQVTAMKQGNCP